MGIPLDSLLEDDRNIYELTSAIIRRAYQIGEIRRAFSSDEHGSVIEDGDKVVLPPSALDRLGASPAPPAPPSSSTPPCPLAPPPPPAARDGPRRDAAGPGSGAMIGSHYWKASNIMASRPGEWRGWVELGGAGAVSFRQALSPDRAPPVRAPGANGPAEPGGGPAGGTGRPARRSIRASGTRRGSKLRDPRPRGGAGQRLARRPLRGPSINERLMRCGSRGRGSCYDPPPPSPRGDLVPPSQEKICAARGRSRRGAGGGGPEPGAGRAVYDI